MTRLVLIIFLCSLASCSFLDRETYEKAEREAKDANVVDTTSYWDYQYVTMARFYEIQCSKAKEAFDKWYFNKSLTKADQSLPKICSPVKGLGPHTGQCIQEQGPNTYKIKDVLGNTTRIDFIKAGERCFADVHILAEVIKNKKGKTACHKGPSPECSILINKLVEKNITFVRELGLDADIYFKETGFKGRLFNMYHFEAAKSAFEESENYRNYSSSPY